MLSSASQLGNLGIEKASNWDINRHFRIFYFSRNTYVPTTIAEMRFQPLCNSSLKKASDWI